MGVDAEIFTKRSKKRLDIDRLYNLTVYWDADNLSPELEAIKEATKRIYEDLRYSWMSASDLRTLAQGNITLAPHTEHNKDRTHWTGQILKLLDLYPDDEFRIVADIEDFYEDNLDGYERIEL